MKASVNVLPQAEPNGDRHVHHRAHTIPFKVDQTKDSAIPFSASARDEREQLKMSGDMLTARFAWPGCFFIGLAGYSIVSLVDADTAIRYWNILTPQLARPGALC